ncbi:MAG: ribosome silencing factor [Zavarzinia sp.]|nr:ribosome silencing factor [Zavarzinia sp.]
MTVVAPEATGEPKKKTRKVAAAPAEATEAEALAKPKRIRLKKVAAEAEPAADATLITVDMEAERKKPRKTKPKKAAPSDSVRALLDLIVKTLDDNKAEEILTIDLAGKSSIADFMVIANGRSGRQVTALADYVVKAVDEAKLGPCRTEGKSAGDWVLIDANDVIVHLFRPEVREFYKLEKMWQADFRPDVE